MTTDPIELWSSPTSQSRIEKENYEAAFGSFFRVQQVIIRSKKSKGFIYQDLFDDQRNFSPLFEKSFMLEVLKLQKRIEGLASPDGVTLSQICHKPLEPEKHDCNVQSIWAYWQDDQTVSCQA